MGWPKGQKRKPTPKQLETLRKHQIKRGECRNPEGGRKHRSYMEKLLSAAYREELARLDPKTQKTIAALIAEGQARSAIKGNTFAAKEIREVLEGKIPDRVSIDNTLELSIVNASDEELQLLIAKYVSKIGGTMPEGLLPALAEEAS